MATTDSTQRIALGLEYDGTAFHGWQRQHHAATVQAAVEHAVSRVANHAVTLHCAGRTDSGVHALEQVVHFDALTKRPLRAWTLGVNAHLPDTISVLWAAEVSTEFHARFSAQARHYRYLILCRPTRSALWRDRALWLHRRLNLAAMRHAGDHLVGTHDFSSFRAQGCQAKSPVRTLHYLTLEQPSDDMIVLAVGADGFLYHMVRNIAGVLIAIGSGEADTDWTAQLLRDKDRRCGGVTAAPHGLYLARIDYPDQFALPARHSAEQAWAVNPSPRAN